MLVGEGAVLGHPVLGVVGELARVADAGVAGGEDPGTGVLVPLGADVGAVELDVHELVHVLQD